jgi:hypothetical protein
MAPLLETAAGFLRVRAFEISLSRKHVCEGGPPIALCSSASIRVPKFEELSSQPGATSF